MAMIKPGVQHLVVDTAAFIKNISLKDLGEEIYTVSAVVHETKNRGQRDRLQVLPYELHITEPTPDCINAVSEFAKKTGDYHSLSKADITVLALAYQLQRNHCGLDSINTRPVSKVVQHGSVATTKHDDAGEIHLSASPLTDPDTTNTESPSISSPVAEIPASSELARVVTVSDAEQQRSKDLFDKLSSLDISSSPPLDPVSPDSKDSLNESNESAETEVEDYIDGSEKRGQEEDFKNDENETDVAKEEEEEEEEEDEDDDDDGEGWITPSNYASVKHTLSDKVQSAKPEGVTVACITMDYAMQNVLMQMGIKVLAMDGMLIKRTNQYVLRCFGCFKINADTSRRFCHHCGNATLKKVAMSVNEDGTVQIHLSQFKKLSARGLRYSLPLPKGGKRANNPILCEDQRECQNQRMSLKAKAKFEAINVEFISHDSPFAPTDVTSRAAVRHFTDQHNSHNRSNPNANNRRRK